MIIYDLSDLLGLSIADTETFLVTAIILFHALLTRTTNIIFEYNKSFYAKFWSVFTIGGVGYVIYDYYGTWWGLAVMLAPILCCGWIKAKKEYCKLLMVVAHILLAIVVFGCYVLYTR